MKNTLIKFLLTSVTILFLNHLSANPVTIIGQTQEQTISISAVSHASFDNLLKTYVDYNGDVNYTDWKKNDSEALETYLGSLASADTNKRAQKAINSPFGLMLTMP